MSSAPIFALAPTPTAINELFKQFMKVYLETNQGPRQSPAERKQPFKAKVLEIYYGKLYMDCYHFCQNCKDYLETAEATKANRTLFTAFFSMGTLVFVVRSSSVTIKVKN